MNSRNPHKQFRPFDEARAFVWELGLKGVSQWREYAGSGQKPDDIPVNPPIAYKGRFLNWSDWLGVGLAQKGGNYLSFAEARAFARLLGLKSIRQWKDYCHSGNKPREIPATPETIYKEAWIDWYDWLGKRRKRDKKVFNYDGLKMSVLREIE